MTEIEQDEALAVLLGRVNTLQGIITQFEITYAGKAKMVQHVALLNGQLEELRTRLDELESQFSQFVVAG